MEKEMMQSLEWVEAQKIEISVDLFAAAKQHLLFLGVVNQNQWLYDGPMLERAVYRYNAYWLPLLAKYSESFPVSEGPLVPPLDCEWVWHCHRLNPARYKSDCEKLYERVLDNYGIVSSINGSCKLRTENLWKILYPMEPYVLDLDTTVVKREDFSILEKCTTYDLVSAAKRQSSFFGKVSRAQVDNKNIMQEVLGRYKAFLYLNKRNHEKSMELLSVPTYDIDFMWHTHMLNPSSYYQDMEKIFGNILQHDDTDANGSKRLKTGFSETTAQWEGIFGQMYSKNVRYFPVADEKNSASCAACLSCGVKALEKKSASCAACLSCGVKALEEKSASCAACLSCGVKALEKKSASCAACLSCGVKALEKNGCLVEENEKSASCAACLSCGVKAVEKKGGCGIIMKNNDNENVQKDLVAA